jgi:hypothetical protein
LVGKRYGWTLTKQRVVGGLLMLPFVGVIAVVVGAGQSGGGMRFALGRLTTNLYTLWFVAGLLGLAAGIRLVARSFKRG